MSDPSPRTRERLRALLFDKDGTLFDFQKAWSPFAARVVAQLAAGEPEQMRVLAAAIGVDPITGRFDLTSPVIAGSAPEIVDALAEHLPDWDGDALAGWLNREAASVGARALAPASTALGPLLAELRSAGFALGVATNDSRAAAEQHLKAARVFDAFDFVAGYDSTPAPKPAPDMILAFADAVGAPIETVVMIGDSPHDLNAARAAGCGAAIAVLTGPTPEELLAPLADAVLPSIDALPAWLAAEARGALSSRP